MITRDKVFHFVAELAQKGFDLGYDGNSTGIMITNVQGNVNLSLSRMSPKEADMWLRAYLVGYTTGAKNVRAT